jgi:hypothetical protein
VQRSHSCRRTTVYKVDEQLLPPCGSPGYDPDDWEELCEMVKAGVRTPRAELQNRLTTPADGVKRGSHEAPQGLRGDLNDAE